MRQKEPTVFFGSTIEIVKGNCLLHCHIKSFLQPIVIWEPTGLTSSK
jgi:hypothetical protein